MVWNVFAAPEFSVHAQGMVLSVCRMRGLQGLLQQSRGGAAGGRAAVREHYDVFVGGVPAYSTLGWLDDPVLNTFVRYPDAGDRAADLPRARAPGRLCQRRQHVQRVLRGHRRAGGRRALARGARHRSSSGAHSIRQRARQRGFRRAGGEVSSPARRAVCRAARAQATCAARKQQVLAQMRAEYARIETELGWITRATTGGSSSR